MEIVDGHDRPLCLMSVREALHQRLYHRAVALLLRDNSGRSLLKLRTGQGWDFSSYTLLAAGQANECAARSLLRQDWQQKDRRLTRLGTCPPETDISIAFTTVFAAYIPAALLTHLATDQNQYLLLDREELEGVEHQLGDVLSPLLRQSLRAGLL